MKLHPVFLFCLILYLSVISFLSFSSHQTKAAPLLQSELASITTPSENSSVRGVISVRGSAVHPNFNRFQVAYAKEPVVQNNQWITIGIERTDQVVNGELAIWDTTTVLDGSYRLRLRVIRNDGNYGEIEIKQIVVGNTFPTDTPTTALDGQTQGLGAVGVGNIGQPAAPPGLVNATATPVPPTATPVVVDLPEVETPTPRPILVVEALPTPPPDSFNSLPIPRVSNFNPDPLRSAFLWGVGGMLLIFLGFGLLSATRIFIQGFLDQSRTSQGRGGKQARWWK